MFNLPSDRMIEPDEIVTAHEKGTIEDCQEIQNIYYVVEKIIDELDEKNNNDNFLKLTLSSHKKLIEERKDWDMCQKTVRRRRIIAMWHNTQMLKSN